MILGRPQFNKECDKSYFQYMIYFLINFRMNHAQRDIPYLIYSIQLQLIISQNNQSMTIKKVKITSILILVALLHLTTAAEVTYSNLKAFWESSYDTDKNGEANLQDFIEYFKFIEPEHQVEKEHAEPIFDFFDVDGNKIVTLEELIKIAQIKVTYNPGHKQIHLGLTANQGQMQVIWVSNPEHYNQPVVEYGHIPGMLKQNSKGTYHTYNVGKVGGFHGRIYIAVMKNLEPVKKYFYRVGDLQTKTYSKIKYFTSPPLRAQTLQQLNIAVFGDMGTFAPFGNHVIAKIAKDHFVKPYHFVFLTGDIAYAGMNSKQRGESEPVWDLYGELTEKFAAYTAFMPGVGNHEAYYNYTAYSNRYVLPRQFPGQTNLFFSFDYGQAHFVHFSSEHPYQLGSDQYSFLERDLMNARNNPSIKWIVVGVHRAFYSSNQDQFANVTNLCRHLEDLMYKYKVDVVQVGHLHNYQRTWPTYRGKAIKQGTNHTHYVDPIAPVYIVQGTAGALIRQRFVKPAPEWSVTRQEKYGYGRMIIRGNTLKYQFISIPAGRVSDEWSIVKNNDNPLPRIVQKQTFEIK